ncbi:MAG: oxidoreductase [candidate division Zixibacteria bacterium SM23_81]|nr:MAG: oxidoreductase [candidate division Zixibacteria bacterium SM23_81]
MYKTKEKIAVGVVGCGYWGPNLIRNFLNNKTCQQVIACDLDKSKLDRIQGRYPSLKVTSHYEDLMDSNEVDAVAIATPVNTHFNLTRDALKAGKHVFVEKPFTASTAEALELIQLAEKEGLTLMVGHTFEYSPPVVKIGELISQGALGEIYFISSSRVNLGLHRKDVSVIWDLASHDFAILFYWLKAAPLRISALGKDYVQRGIPDVAFINMEFPSGCVAHVEVSWLAPSKLRRTAVIGSEKMLVYDDTEVMEKVKIYDKGVDYKEPYSFGEFQLSYRAGDIVSPKLDSYEPLGVEVAHFFDCIRNGKKPRTDGYSGLRVVQALEATQKSLENNGHVERIE